MPGYEPIAEIPLEARLQALEAMLGVVITVRDLTGWLRGNDGKSLIDPRRNGHQRQAVCARGFTPACVAHCRHATNAALRDHPGPHVSSCWKQVREVVVPVTRQGTLQGYLFAGAWRVPGPPPQGAWLAAWRRLPAWSATRGAAVTAALAVVADGLWEAAARARTAFAPADRPGLIRQFIRAHLAQPVGRDGLARHLGLSPSRTSHAVREACGTSLQQVVAEERVAAAKRLLADSTESVAAIGAAVGWPDPPHFTRIFRRLTGLPPGAWREQHRLA